MAQTIQFRRGNEVNLPSLVPGEPAITLDTTKLFVGTPQGNTELAKQTDLDGRGVNVKTAGAIGDGVVDDTLIFSQLANESTIHLPYATYKVASLPILPSYIKSDQATISISGKHEFTSPLFAGSVSGKLKLKGENTIPFSITNITLVSESTFSTEYYSGDIRNAKYQRLTLTLNISTAEIGDVVVINNIDASEFMGAYEVISVNGLTLDVISLSQYSLSTKAVTGSGYLIKTVFRFLGNKTAFINENNSTLELENIAVLGHCFPYAYNGRDNNYDPAGSKGGVTGIIARNSSQLIMRNSTVMGFSGSAIAGNDVSDVLLENSAVSNGGRNGIVGASTSKVTTNLGTVISHNLLDGIIAQDSSFVFATNTPSVGNGRHGFISAGMSALNVTNAKAEYNGYLDITGNGVEANSSLMIAIGIISKTNSNIGLRALGNGVIRATGVTVTGNKEGVVAETQSQITVSGTVNANTTTDLKASGGSFILATGTTYTTFSPVANTYTPDGSFIQTVSTVDDIRFSSNGTNSAMILNTANQQLLGFGSAVTGINARSYVSGNQLVKGDTYLLGDDGKYYKVSIVGGALTVTATAVTG